LLERGFASFAFVGLQDYWFSREREQSFADLIAAQQGLPCPVFNLRERNRTTHYGLDQGKLVTWLKGLPKPVGLLACNDDCGREVLDAALMAGIAVPDEISLMGVDNDEVLCDLCCPPLSSIIPNAFQAGFEAATLLQRMMAGENLPGQTVMINPIGVATRQSTDVVAVNDKQVAAAVRFIRENACKRIAVEDVLKAVPMSRTLLERRFKKLLGHTPHDHILKVKIERLKHMLVTTDLSLALIADRTGFEHVEYLSVVFKRATGISPSQFRSQCKMVQGRNSC
jgi:LacI family transcriptional regulator